MSLTSRLEEQTIREKIDPLLPERPGTMDLSTRVNHEADRHSRIGTAFDYALRIELRRLAEEVERRGWLAEKVASSISPITQEGLPPHHAIELGEVAEDAIPTVIAARDFVDETYVHLKASTEEHRRTLAEHTLKLARLDEVHRAGHRAAGPFDVHDEDIDEIAQLLEIAPADETLDLAEGPIRLNPVFGEFSARVGGADADLIHGDMLVEIKTTTKPKVGKKQLRQLVGYKILQDEHARADGEGPKISEIGIYFARQAHLWTEALELDRSSDEYKELLDELLDPPEQSGLA